MNNYDLLEQRVQRHFESECDNWPLARDNYAALRDIKEKSFDVYGAIYRVQYNPQRIHSSTALVDEQSISERPCFLCVQNLPTQQKALVIGKTCILVNPYPIFNRHLTLAFCRHSAQRIKQHIKDMFELSAQLPESVVFYNGPLCGASAPDHAHFQAGNRGFLPIENDLETFRKIRLVQSQTSTLHLLNDKLRGPLLLQSTNEAEAYNWFITIYLLLRQMFGTKGEPMMNLLMWCKNDKWTLCIFPRIKHRPSCYFDESQKMLVSPGAVDLGGVIVTSRIEDFNRMTAETLEVILSEVCWTHENRLLFCKLINKRL